MSGLRDFVALGGRYSYRTAGKSANLLRPTMVFAYSETGTLSSRPAMAEMTNLFGEGALNRRFHAPCQ
jgi:hypothetical protein